MNVTVSARRKLAALFLLAAAIVAILLALGRTASADDKSAGAARVPPTQSSEIRKLRVSIGDNLAKVREVFATRLEPQPCSCPGIKNGTDLRFIAKGVWLFFDRPVRL